MIARVYKKNWFTQRKTDRQTETETEGGGGRRRKKRQEVVKKDFFLKILQFPDRTVLCSLVYPYFPIKATSFKLSLVHAIYIYTRTIKSNHIECLPFLLLQS